MTLSLALIPGLPLLSAIATAALGPRVLKERSHWPTIVALGGSLLLSLRLLATLLMADSGQGPQEDVVCLWTWANVEGAYTQQPSVDSLGSEPIVEGGVRDFNIEIALRADTLTGIMLSMVTFVSLCVAVYASGYMRGDPGYWRFYAIVSLFVFSMTMLVSVSNYLLLYVFWEGVGVCSYLLIGFYYQKPSAAAAGKKAFLVNRVGDFGLALGIFLIWTTYGTLNFHDASAVVNRTATEVAGVADPSAATEALASTDALAQGDQVAGVLGERRISGKLAFAGGGVGLAICLLLLVGACGKSAQLPLHVWLADAMEGPSPVSALIHAATMVTAGVYLVARSFPLFVASPSAMLVVAVIGGATALMAAVIAVTQYDLKRVLAYSTMSQLGYMFMALGCGTAAGATAGMFHLFTHAFFKALLFLGAGSVMHAMGGVIDMQRFGGLRYKLRWTCLLFLVGCLALSGVWPLSGFYSKDAIIVALREKSETHGSHHESTPEDLHETHAGSATADSLLASQALHITPTDAPSINTSSTEVALSGESLTHTPATQAAFSETSGSDTSTTSVSTASTRDNQVASTDYAAVYRLLYYVSLVVAFLTALYTFRAFFLTFFGQQRIPAEAAGHAHEAPREMLIPMAVLAVCALLVGKVTAGAFHVGPSNWLARTPSLATAGIASHGSASMHQQVAIISLLLAIGGIGSAAFMYLGHQREVKWLQGLFSFAWLPRLTDLAWWQRCQQGSWVVRLQRAAKQVGLGWVLSGIGHLATLMIILLMAPLLVGYYLNPYQLSRNKFYFDEIYEAFVVWPMRMVARIAYAIDRHLVDGLVNLVGRLPVWGGTLMRSLQMGLLSFYTLAMVLSVLILLAAGKIWAGG